MHGLVPAPGRPDRELRDEGRRDDLRHGFLDYPLEHHLFPDLPPLEYPWLQPRVREVRERHGVHDRQESVFTRPKKLVADAIGDASMAVA